MKNIRIIARLDIKAPNLIKGIHLEGLRVIGDPLEYATKYYNDGADELLYMDIVASLYNRNQLLGLVERTARGIFIPITVGGGIRNVDDAHALLRAGADKVAINTAATKRPELITDIAKRFGSQCMILSIEAKRVTVGKWEVFTDNGREHTGLDVVEWAKKGAQLGAGEIIVTSVDQEGTRHGFDVDLVRAVSEAVSIPVVASGGMGQPEHLVGVVKNGKADAVAMADVLHYNRFSLPAIRQYARSQDLMVRDVPL
ncbi:MAG: imidazole glycerol phosphate synthase subunit HisF [Bdellovibrionales bacterium RIFOXYD1_FULL_53_11]|nr:MAG: imidazole glycerol phosphate synthase subunit HisF [Bdellovibrionales bacterium RIFOXYD1_FULL_53_11]